MIRPTMFNPRMKKLSFVMLPLVTSALLSVAIVAPASAVSYSMLPGLQTSTSANLINVRQLKRCRQQCDEVVVGRRCAAATGWFNPQTGDGQSSQCQRYEPITQTLCRETCTSGGVWFVETIGH